MQFYSARCDLPYSDEELSVLERRFQDERGLLPIHPTPARQRLLSQLVHMMKDAALQPRGSIRNFVKYPVFEAYTEALLGR